MIYKLRAFLKLLLPPIFVKLARAKFFVRSTYHYSPKGWNTPISKKNDEGWNSVEAVKIEMDRWEAYCNALQGPGPIGFMHEHNDPTEIKEGYHHRNITFGYVFALAAIKKETISILDYGGSLGHNYFLAKAFLPDKIKINFHCKEVPRLVEIGKKLNPNITWYTDDDCLKRQYDLIIVNGVLGYIEDWRELLTKIERSVGLYLFLGHVPIVNNSDGFVMLQRRYKSEMLHYQFNKSEFLSSLNLPLEREFITGVFPIIKNAPEQCELRSFLFRNNN